MKNQSSEHVPDLYNTNSATELMVIDRPNLPMVEQEFTDLADESFQEFVEVARSKNFSKRSMNTVLAQRRRLYTERDQIWERGPKYGAQALSDFESTDDDEAFSIIMDNFMADLEDEAYVKYGIDPNSADEPFYFRAWTYKNWIYDEHIKTRIHSEYATWLTRQVMETMADAQQLADSETVRSQVSHVAIAAEHANRFYHDETLGKLTAKFKERTVQGMTSLREQETLPEARDSAGKLPRLIGRSASTEKLHDQHRPDYEMKLLRSFMGIAGDMTSIISFGGIEDSVRQAIDTFETSSGVADAKRLVENYLCNALGARINMQTIEEFLSQYDEEIDNTFRRRAYSDYWSGGRSGRTNHRTEDVPKYPFSKSNNPKFQEAESPKTEFKAVHGYFRSCLTIQKDFKLDESAQAQVAHEFTAALENLQLKLRVHPVVALYLVNDLLRTIKTEPLDDFRSKLHFRKLMKFFHSDIANLNRQQTQPDMKLQHELASSAGNLYGLFDEGYVSVERGESSFDIRFHEPAK